jgi:hypothetical protein
MAPTLPASNRLARRPTQNDEDKALSERMRHAIGPYMKYKYLADSDLVKRTKFKWTIVRPGGLRDESGKGTAAIGRTHLTESISVRSTCLLAGPVLTEWGRGRTSRRYLPCLSTGPTRLGSRSTLSAAALTSRRPSTCSSRRGRLTGWVEQAASKYEFVG